MSDGLITRIGKWIDSKWETKATESQLQAVKEEMDKNGIVLAEGLKLVLKKVTDQLESVKVDVQCLNKSQNEIADTVNALPVAGVTQSLSKDLADLKTRLEKLELYTGMTRKVDPTKQPVAKSAFSM